MDVGALTVINPVIGSSLCLQIGRGSGPWTFPNDACAGIYDTSVHETQRRRR